LDFAEQRLKRIWRNTVRRQTVTLNTGFSGLTDFLDEATKAGKRRIFPFSKSGVRGNSANFSRSLWAAGTLPATGVQGPNAPGGGATDDTTVGAFPFTNPTSPDTQHFAGGLVRTDRLPTTLLLYDRLFHVNKTMSSTTTEAVTGVPVRYQSQVATDQDYIGGNFLFVEIFGSDLGGTAHNWTVCLYTDQDGNSSTLPSVAGDGSGAQDDSLDIGPNLWFAPLESGDRGVKALTQMQCSASVTGTVVFAIGHPIAFMPCPVTDVVCKMDGINSSFNLVRIFDDACLALLCINPASGTMTAAGSFVTVSG
jgi:hypothetical protein